MTSVINLLFIYLQVLCVRDKYKQRLVWKEASTSDLCAPKNSISSGDVLIGRAEGRSGPEASMKFPGAVRPGEKLKTAFPKMLTRTKYEVLCIE